jgi:hypothetical protein
MEATHNVVHWTKEQHGGHFAAMEKPQELVADIRRFFLEVAPNHNKRAGPKAPTQA